MEVHTRETNDAKMIDLLGEFPSKKDDFDGLRTQLEVALEGDAASWIIHITDATRFQENHMFFLLATLRRAKIQNNSFSFVWPYWEKTDVSERPPLIAIYANEEEALNAGRCTD